MTDRKPPTMSINDWVESQIRRADAEGAFDNLPGAGKPIPGLDTEQDPLTWVAKKLRAEQVDPSVFLPPQLALAREVERLPGELAAMPSERMVLNYLADLNARIDRAHARPVEGPPMRTKLVNVPAAVEQWRQSRAALAPALVPVVAEPTVTRRRFFTRRVR